MRRLLPSTRALLSLKSSSGLISNITLSSLLRSDSICTKVGLGSGSGCLWVETHHTVQSHTELSPQVLCLYSYKMSKPYVVEYEHHAVLYRQCAVMFRRNYIKCHYVLHTLAIACTRILYRGYALVICTGGYSLVIE